MFLKIDRKEFLSIFPSLKKKRKISATIHQHKVIEVDKYDRIHFTRIDCVSFSFFFEGGGANNIPNQFGFFIWSSCVISLFISHISSTLTDSLWQMTRCAWSLIGSVGINQMLRRRESRITIPFNNNQLSFDRLCNKPKRNLWFLPTRLKFFAHDLISIKER